MLSHKQGARALAQIELTLMVQTLRPLPLAPLRNALVSRMSQAMRSRPYAWQVDPDRVRPP